MRIDTATAMSGPTRRNGGIEGAEPGIAGAWEACAAFAAGGDGSPVCERCGWLLDDHGERAVVRRLPAPATRPTRPQRLAS
jgi:hypothetical protein